MAVTPAPPIDALPTAPNRSMASAVYVAVANAWVAALAVFGVQVGASATATQANASAAETAAAAAEADAVTAEAAAAAALNASGYMATSTTPMSMSAGAKTPHLAQSRPALAVDGMQLVAIRAADVETRLYGVVSGSDGSDDFTFTVASDGVVGSGGPYSDWVFIWAGFFATGATGDEVRAMVSAAVAITPASEAQALAPVALTSGSTITPNFGAGVDFTCTLGHTFTLAAATGAKVGMRRTIQWTQDATGSRIMAVASCYKRTGSLGVLSTTAGYTDEMVITVRAVDGSGVVTRATYTLDRNPT